ncbi:lipoyl domain-containing protein [Croceicoccus marinus]|uniref:Biotin attachment protein n=1 Tax=Croceicoccus marinus TaxID=450378 RepID=A0A1Z1FGR0_9SPHN|nr:lipoyl domain-containing protein [Croceicoccus marinus]ARU17913.1 biotin attachment protein [Croceicoccus marinus]QNE07419.1 biotin attachment protein [Croceicoccus marinus]
MADIDVMLPQFGMGMQDAEIVRWLKQPGDRVEEGEPLVEIEAAKTTVEVPAPASGILKEILAQPEETVEVRAKIAVITA